MLPCALLVGLVAGVTPLAAAPAATTPAAAAPPTWAPVSLAVGNFAAWGVEPSQGVAAAAALREGLAGNPLLALKQEAKLLEKLNAQTEALLANRTGVAANLGKELGVRLLVTGLLWQAEGRAAAQLVVLDTRPRVARVYATPALPWPEESAEQKAVLLAALQTALPPVGRVLAIISAPGGADLQVFPFAGVPLKAETTYVAARGLMPEPAPGRPEYLPILWPGKPGARLRTGGQRADDAIGAKQQGEGTVEVGDLVYVPLTEGYTAAPSPARLLLSDPPLAEVRSAEGLLGVTPLVVTEEQAGAGVELVKEDYVRRPVKFAGAASVLEGQSEQLALLPPEGTLVVATKPKGATLTLDGQKIGESPVTRERVPMGEHTLVVTLAGFHPQTQKVTIRRAKETALDLDLARQLRGLRVVTKPAGAEVAWDGEVLGKSPATLAETTVGNHTVRVTLAGYDELEREVEVPWGEKPHEVAFDLVKRVGKLAISSKPTGAKITVNGEAKAAAPLELGDLPPGEYEITATLDGYRVSQQTAVVKPHETTRVEMALDRKVGVVAIKTVPPGAKITLDGQDKGTSPATLENIPAGEHTLRLELANLRPWQGKIQVQDRETTEVQVGLLPLAIELSSNGPGTGPTRPTPSVPSGPTPAVGGAAPMAGGSAVLQITEYEGAEVPASLPLLDLGNNERRTWTLRLLKSNEPLDVKPNAVQLDFQPRADGGLTVGLRLREALAGALPVEKTVESITVGLAGLRAEHNPAGYQVNYGGLRAVKVTNSGAEGAARVELILGSGVQATVGQPTAGGELVITLMRPIDPSGQKLVALTFDDTPFPGGTERLLQILREQQVTATFFVVGRKAAENPEVIRKAYQDGHSLENHSYSHPRLSDLSAAEIEKELRQCSDALQRILGVAPKFYRPPGGQSNSLVHRTAEKMGLRYAGWDVNVHDYDAPNAQFVVDRVVSGTAPGNIILLHDAVEPTLQALPEIIRRLREKGFVFVTLGRLLEG